MLNICTRLWLTESERTTPVDSIKDIVRSSVKVPEFDKHLKKAGGHIDRNVVEIKLKMKTIVRKPLMINIYIYIYIYLYTYTHKHTHKRICVCVCVCVHVCACVCVFGQDLFVNTYLIKQNRHPLSTHFMVSGLELVNQPPIINCFPRIFCLILCYHQGCVYCKSDVIFACT